MTSSRERSEARVACVTRQSFSFLSGAVAFARAKSPFQILVKNEVTGFALLNVLHCLTSEHVTALRRGDFIFCINPSKKIRTATNRVWNRPQASIVDLTPSLQWRHLTRKRSVKVRNLKPLSLCVFFFALACERIFIKMHSIESRSVLFACASVHLSLSPGNFTG